MKKLIILLLCIITFAGCGAKKSIKVSDPAERAAMRTRDASCPINEVFSAKGLKITFNVISQIKPKALVADYKEALSISTETKTLKKAKEAYSSVKDKKAGEYNPGLTIYCTLMMVTFVLIVIGKVIYALFHND